MTSKKNVNESDFPGVQWLRMCLPIQETWGQSLVQEDLTCHGAANPIHHNYSPSALQLEKPAHLNEVHPWPKKKGKSK